MVRVTFKVEMEDYDESKSLRRKRQVKRVRAGFLAINASSRLWQKTGGKDIIAKSIGNPCKEGERAKLCSLHLSTAYNQELRFSPAPL